MARLGALPSLPCRATEYLPEFYPVLLLGSFQKAGQACIFVLFVSISISRGRDSPVNAKNLNQLFPRSDPASVSPALGILPWLFEAL